MSKIAMPIPPEWGVQDIVFHHMRKVGEYITTISRRPYLWDRMSQKEQQQWVNQLHNELGVLIEVQDRLNTALYFTSAVVIENGQSRLATDKAEVVLAAIVDVSQDYLAVELSEAQIPYNPLLRGQQICLNCQQWNPNLQTCKEGICRANGGDITASTASCEKFEQFSPSKGASQ